MEHRAAFGVHLARVEAPAAGATALATSPGAAVVGVAGVLAGLDRSAAAVRVPGSAARWGLRWAEPDQHDPRWWPQGITSSGDDASSEGTVSGRSVLCTSWYSKVVGGVGQGARVTFLDLDTLRYRHVLLVEPVVAADGSLTVRPVKVHAGGLVWHDGLLHVAATGRGLLTFDLAGLVRTGSGPFGYEYLLPLTSTWASVTADGVEPMRYSFVALDRDGGGAPRLVVGEYGRGSAPTRLAVFPLVAGASLHPSEVGPGVPGMQGAVVVAGRWYVTTSAGKHCRGSLYAGRPGALRRHPWVLPVGVEDVTYWPGRDELWSLTEYPGRRYVFAMDRGAFG